MVLNFEFWNDLKNAEISQRPTIVKKHYLSIYELETAGKILREGKLEEEWFNQLYIACTGCGLRKSELVFEKYGIPNDERDALEEKFYQKFYDECDRCKFNN